MTASLKLTGSHSFTLAGVWTVSCAATAAAAANTTAMLVNLILIMDRLGVEGREARREVGREGREMVGMKRGSGCAYPSKVPILTTPTGNRSVGQPPNRFLPPRFFPLPQGFQTLGCDCSARSISVLTEFCYSVDVVALRCVSHQSPVGTQTLNGPR